VPGLTTPGMTERSRWFQEATFQSFHAGILTGYLFVAPPRDLHLLHHQLIELDLLQAEQSRLSGGHQVLLGLLRCLQSCLLGSHGGGILRPGHRNRK
jgi:hypothetical protein